MTGNVVQLPTERAVSMAWDVYATKARAMHADAALRTDYAFNVGMVRAWAEFRDLFIAHSERAK